MRGSRWMIVAGLAAVVALAVLALVVLAPRPQPAILAARPVPAPDYNAAAVAGVYATYPDPAWVSATATAVGLPEQVIAAYGGATLALADELPQCRLTWTTIAAIGTVESSNGTHGGAVLGADNVPSPPILGPVLDGGDFGEIADTDGGVLDGDPVWDRAVGPMQFLPQTWSLHGADGDGDGVKNPQDLDDATLAAARYLCLAVDADTSDPQTWRDAVTAYNRSVDYVNLVAEISNRYADAAAAE